MLRRTLPTLADRFARAGLRAQGFTSRHVETSVGRVHTLDVRGNGPLPPIVMLHGFSSAGVHYYRLLQALRDKTRRVVAPDLPGHGFSAMPTGGLVPATLSAGLVEALDALIGEPVVLFGNSMGGLAAARYAARRPDAVRGLILVSPAGAPMTPDELDVFRAGFAMPSHADAVAFVERLTDNPPRMKNLIAWGVRERFRRRAMRQLIGSLETNDLLSPEELGGLRCPTLLLWGQSERILPASGLSFFRQHLPAASWIEEPPGWGHGPFLEYPDEVTAWILRFLEVIESAEAAGRRAVP